MKVFTSLILSLVMVMPTVAISAEAAAAADANGDQAVQAAEALVAGKEDALGSAANTDQKNPGSTKNLKETEIPVNLETAKKASSGEGSLFKILSALGILGLLACAAYFFIKKYTIKTGKTNQATQIKILTQHYLGPKKSLAIVRVAGESILIGITDQNISLIKALSLLDEEIPEETPKSFNNVFNKTQKNNSFAAAAANEASEDDFAISGIKDFVSSKLKNMRSLE